MLRLTLAKVNKHIQAKYPLIQLVKGEGYFYVHSDDDAMGLKLAMLFTTSIPVYAINQLTIGGWMDSVEYVLRDGQQVEWNRNPII